MAVGVSVELDVLGRLRRLFRDGDEAESRLLATMFEREAPTARSDVDAILDTGDIRCLVDLDLVRRHGERYLPLARIDRVDGLLVASDLRDRRRQADFVVEPGPASFLLAGFVRRGHPGKTLDLGCGSGIQGLVLASAGGAVVAIDINPRAVGYARFNGAFNGFRDIRPEVGDFLSDRDDGRRDGRFDTVVANPPFVLAPACELTYRDSPLPRDRVSMRTIERAARALAPGGRGYVLCNWIDEDGMDWSAPVRRWLEPCDVEAVVTRVGDLAVVPYAAIWNRDLAEPQRSLAISAWRRALEAEGVRRVHVGVVAMGRADDRTRRRPRFIALDRREQAVSRDNVESYLQGAQ